MIPGVGISTDIITGFCGETAADHEDTVSLMREASYEQVVQRPSVYCSAAGLVTAICCLITLPGIHVCLLHEGAHPRPSAHAGRRPA